MRRRAAGENSLRGEVRVGGWVASGFWLPVNLSGENIARFIREPGDFRRLMFQA